MGDEWQVRAGDCGIDSRASAVRIKKLKRLNFMKVVEKCEVKIMNVLKSVDSGLQCMKFSGV